MNQLLEFGRGFFDWTWKTSLCAAGLSLLVMGAQAVLGKRLTARWRYRLSLLVLVRLLLPLAPSSPLSWENLLPGAARHQEAVAAVPPAPDNLTQWFEPGLSISPAALPPTHSSLRGFDLLGLIWMAGGAVLAALAAWRYRRWRLWTKAGEAITEPRLLALLDSARGNMGVRQRVAALAVRQATGPAVFGIRSARLLLPRNVLDRLSDVELRLVLLHEMAHVRRKDALLNALLMAVQFLHWFNPFVWLAFHRIRADRELVCDEMVMQLVAPEERAGYGRLLLKMINEFPTGARFLPGTAAAVGNQQEIKRRIFMIKNHGKKSVAGSVLAAAAILALGCATFTRALSSPSAPTEAAQKSNDLAGTWIMVGKPGDTNPPAPTGRIKFITGTRWDMTQYDPKTGVTMFHHGGTYTLEGNDYRETIEYANESSANLIKHTLKFTIKVDGDTLTLTGVGNPFNEVWKRMK